MTVQWYYHVSGEDRGPISSSELRACVQSLIVRPGTLVRRATDRNWVPAAKVPGLLAKADGSENGRKSLGESVASNDSRNRSRIKTTALGICDEIDDAMGIIRGLIEYYDLNKSQIATICEIISPIAEQLRDLEQDLP
jgi:hypothetical protein